MKRLVLVAAFGAAMYLGCGVAAAAPPQHQPLHAHKPARAVTHAVRARAASGLAPFRFVPLGRRLAGTATITLDVAKYDGSPEAGARGDWWVTIGDRVAHGTATAGADGRVVMTGARDAGYGNGEVAATVTDPLPAVYDLSGLSWTTTLGPVGLQPGQFPVTLIASSDANWNYWPQAQIDLWSTVDAQTHLARTSLPRVGATSRAMANTINGSSATQTLSGGTLHFWADEGMPLNVSGIPVSTGSTASGLVLREDDARRVWVRGWGSGAPGTTTSLYVDNYAYSNVLSVDGVADYPADAPVRDYGTIFSTGMVSWERLTIPSRAAPGYAYWLLVSLSNSDFQLVTSFQTCTLKPSASAVRRGSAATLSGVVPIKGHYGTKKGTPKYVTLYKTTNRALGAAGQPPAPGGAARVAGWTKVARTRTDGLGKYRKSLTPSRNTWYAVWYPGDAWYWGAWTAVTKVLVK